MLNSSPAAKNPIAVLRTAFGTILFQPIILFPFLVIAAIQVFILEIIFFAPRYPLSIFFKPFISYLYGERFLHYPDNFFVVVRWFQHWILQFPVYVVFNCFFFGVAVVIINTLNSEKKIDLKVVIKQTLSAYAHLLVTGVLSVTLLFSLSNVYGLLLKRAALIRSKTGIFFILKKIIIQGAPYFNLLIAVLVSTLLAFVIPIIIIERKKIFPALWANFKYLWKSFWFVFILTLLPVLLYIPIILLKMNDYLLETIFNPEAAGVILLISIFTTLIIDALQYTAITTFYLLKKETQ